MFILITVDKSLSNGKIELLDYFRERGNESLQELKTKYGSANTAKVASGINRAIGKTGDMLVKTLHQKSIKEKWANEEIVECIMMITYTKDVVMLESRNAVRPYEYMDFSRRIGEMWEPFCKICFEYPVNDINLFIPPVFSVLQGKLKKDFYLYIDSLVLTQDQKIQIKFYYEQVWSLVNSGEIKLELDLHFELSELKYVVDFKSGFNSNEKGNVNRILLVGTAYKYLDDNYKPVLIVRSAEESNNNYFKVLKNSGIWEAYCADEAYAKLSEYSGFDIKNWIASNVLWEEDLNQETISYFNSQSLDQYLKW